MNNYNVLEYQKEYNLKDLSAEISCRNMSILSKKYTDNQKFLFDNNINYELCDNYRKYFLNLDNIKEQENDILSGISIGKKSCIYKKDAYQEGDWEYQYGISDTFRNQVNSHELFNYQSKAKTNNINNKCNYKFQILGECDKGPYNTYVKTFTTDYNNCI